MFKSVEELSKEDADHILERWDQSAPEMQRMVVLQLSIELERLSNIIRGFVKTFDGDMPVAGADLDWLNILAQAREAIKMKGNQDADRTN